MSAPGERTTRGDLVRLAESVTLAQPRDLRTPFRLGALPNGLAVTYVRSVRGEATAAAASVGLSDPAAQGLGGRGLRRLRRTA